MEKGTERDFAVNHLEGNLGMGSRVLRSSFSDGLFREPLSFWFFVINDVNLSWPLLFRSLFELNSCW